MANHKLGNYKSIVVGTGNILDNDEFKKASTPTSEVRKFSYLHMTLLQNRIVKFEKHSKIVFYFRWQSA